MRIDRDEALRYCGVRTPDDAMRAQMRQIADELTATMHPRSVWKVFDLERSPDGILLPACGLLLTGSMARKMLATCDRAVLMACTLGPAFDTLLRGLQMRDMAKALMTDACGSAMIEAVCNDAELEIDQSLPGVYRTDRFSPGYGDLPLALQSGLLSAIDAARRTGITLLESDLMNPSKSVTAVIGLSSQPQPARIRGCTYCNMNQQCTLRKRGMSCGDQN